MDLMKRLRAAKSASVGTKEEKKKAMSALDIEIHKLLGHEYKRYRAVQAEAKTVHQAKKAPPGSVLPAKIASPLPAVAHSTSSKKKKSSSTTGAGSKKVKTSTTVG